jgi:hypothetical protein
MMQTLGLKEIQIPDCGTVTTCDGSSITVQMKGNWDMNAVAPLDEFTRALEKEAERLQVAQVVMNWTEVEFINSSCLKSFARWVGSLSRPPQAQKYTLEFFTNHAWQRRSLEALKALGRDKVLIKP